MINKKTIYTQVVGCLLEEMDEGALIYNPGTTTALQLNSSSTLIWQLCDGSHSVEDIVAYLSENFPEAVAHIEQDVMITIMELSREGVLTTIDG